MNSYIVLHIGCEKDPESHMIHLSQSSHIGFLFHFSEYFYASTLHSQIQVLECHEEHNKPIASYATPKHRIKDKII